MYIVNVVFFLAKVKRALLGKPSQIKEKKIRWHLRPHLKGLVSKKKCHLFRIGILKFSVAFFRDLELFIEANQINFKNELSKMNLSFWQSFKQKITTLNKLPSKLCFKTFLESISMNSKSLECCSLKFLVYIIICCWYKRIKPI